MYVIGTDIMGSSKAGPMETQAATREFMVSMVKCTKPIFCAVNGSAVGIGVTMLPHCDIVVGTRGTQIWTPFSSICYTPEFASSKLFPELMVRRTYCCFIYIYTNKG